MSYFKQDGAMHGWNDRDGYRPAAPITRIICDECAGTPGHPGEVQFEVRGRPHADGTPHYMQVRPWKWAPWVMGQPCDGCGRTDAEVRP